MAEVGILGGTFNPPHVGHLVLVQEALDQLDLDRVLLMPVAQPPHKEALDEPGAPAPPDERGPPPPPRGAAPPRPLPPGDGGRAARRGLRPRDPAGRRVVY